MFVLLRVGSRIFQPELFSTELVPSLIKKSQSRCLSSKVEADSDDAKIEEEEFRVFELIPKKKEDTRVKRNIAQHKLQPRYKQMPVDQDWSNVWPGPRSFHPATVPLPLHQGYEPKLVSPGKFANAELMKIPNFLHLTPPAIAKHCEALKKFCTKWPEELSNEEIIDDCFPVNIITSDYCHSSPTIRDPNARIVSLKIKLSSLELDSHAKDKILRLVGKRYDSDTDVITLTTDSCPIRKQNYDYLHYLLTALYHESWITEDWEKEKIDIDMEVYIWKERKCKENVDAVFLYNNTDVPDTTNVAASVEDLLNNGENLEKVDKYKESVVELMGLPKLPNVQ